MATYTIDTSNWNSAAFWGGISETTGGHTIDFSLLGAGYTVDAGSVPGLVTISDGTTSFSIGDAGFAGAADATLGGTTSWNFFSSLIGGDGDDTLNGTTGDDTIFGNNGGDYIVGGTGADRVFGEDGDDTISVRDGYGDDTITGGNGSEVAGDALDMGFVTTDLTVDLTDARTGYGTVSGADGTLRFSEIEHIILSSGTDTVVLADGSGSDIIVNFKPPVDNGDGTYTAIDLFDVTGVTGSSGPLTAGDVTVTDTNGDGTGDAILTFPGGENVTIVGVQPSEVGSPDQLVAMGFPPARDYIVEGGAGDDNIVGGYVGDPEGDLIDSNDNLAGNNDDVVLAGAGDDTVEAGAGADLVRGEAGNDSLSGDDGDDTLDGGTGNDAMFGRADADTFVVTDGFGSDTVTGGEAVVTGTDYDTLDLSALTTGVDGSLSADEAGNVLNGTDNVLFSEIENIVLTGSADQFGTGGDTTGVRIEAGAGDDTLIGDNGADTLLGGAGSDLFTYTAATGNDSLVGGETGTDADMVDLSAQGSGANVVFSGNESGSFSVGGDTSTFEEMEAFVLTGQNDTVDASADAAGTSIDAGAGDDTVLGGAGDDSLQGAEGADTIDGGAGSDTLRGGTGNDLINGGAGDEEIYGDEDDDTLIGGDGADTIEGGSGNDSILGGAGMDSINGDVGDDSIHAGDGDDFLRGSYGSDTLNGGLGDDYIWGGFRDDLFIVENNFGNDTYVGEDQEETLGDTLDLSAVTDALTIDLTNGLPSVGSFTDGTDTATFAEIENIVLGSGTDTLLLADGGGADAVSGFAAPTDNGDGTFTGIDQLDVSGLTSDGTTPVTTADVTVTDDGSGNAVLTFPGGESLTLTGVPVSAVQSVPQLVAMGIPAAPVPKNYVVEGDDGANTINAAYSGDPEGDRVDAGDNLAGTDDDSIVAAGGNDAISAGAGNDTVDAGAGDDTLDGGAGDDSLLGGDGDDVFVIGDGGGSDVVLGGETGETAGDTLDLSGMTQPSTVYLTGSDPEAGSVLSSGGQSVTFTEIENITLGGGTDTLVLGDGSGADAVSGFAAPTDNGDGTFTGIDLLDVSGLTSDGTTPVTTADVTVTDDGSGNAVLTFPGGESLTLTGVPVSAVQSVPQLVAMGIPDGRGPLDYIVEGAGTDDLINDTYTGDPDGDRIDAGDNLAGNDDDLVQAGAGDDTVNAGLGNDTIFGGEGANILRGSDGDDVLYGGTGNDEFYGGADSDRFVLEPDFGDDDVVGGEAVTTGTDFDTIDLSGLTDAANVELLAPESGSVTAGANGILFDEIENIVLTDYADQVATDRVDSGIRFEGGLGNDTFIGDGGDDTFLGGDDADTFTYAAQIGGNDSVVGGEGGTDNDFLQMNLVTAPVTLTYASAEAGTATDGTGTTSFEEIERIALTGGNDTVDASAITGGIRVDGNAGDDSFLGGTGDDSIDGGNDNDSIDGGAGDDSLLGGAGNDTLIGGLGSDALEGGDGDDLFVIENLFGDDDVTGGELGETDGDTLDLTAVTDDLTLDLTDADGETGVVSDGTFGLGFSEIENIFLGSGTDTLELADGSGADRVSGFAAPTDNGDGTFTPGDLLDVSFLTSDGGTTPVETADVTVTDDGSGNAVLTFPGGESLTLVGVAPAAVSSPAALAAMGIPLSAGGPDFIVEGTSGDDAIVAGYLGDPEGDEIDNLDGPAGGNNDSVEAGAGNDAIESGLGEDTVNAGDGNDTLNGEGGADILRGEGGDDTFVLEDGFGADTVTGGETGETVGDTLDLTAVTTGVRLDLRGTDPEAGTVTSGTDTATFSEIETILLSGGADTIALGDGSGADVAFGFAAPVDNGDGTFTPGDLLDVSGLTSDGTTPVTTADVTVTDTNGDGTGDAILTFPNGESITLEGVPPSAVSDPAQLEAMGIPAAPILPDFIVEGTSGDDTIDTAYTGDPEGDRVDNADGPGGGDNDVIDAGAGNDLIDAGAGADTVGGGAGNDTIAGGTGADVLSGGDDRDTFTFADGSGLDTVAGGEGGDDLDTLDATGFTGAVTVTMTGAESGTLLAGSDSVTFSEIEAILMNAQDDTFIGAADSAGITADGGAGNDDMTGGSGHDALSGGAGNDTLFGGDGADTLDGGAGNDVFRVGSNDSALGGDGDDVFNVGPTDLTGSTLFIDGGETGEVLGDTLNITGPATVTMTGTEAGRVVWLNGSTLDFTNIENVTYTACFTTGTRIATPEGEIAVEHLSAGDRVLTRDAGIQTLRWVGGRAFTAEDLRAQPHLAPIRIAAGALGDGLPVQDLVLSPQHRVLIASAAAELWFGEDEVLVAAQDLLVLDGVKRIFPEDGIRYFHFLCDRHQVVLSNGAWTESFQPGDLSLSSLDDAQRAEIFAIFPELATDQGRAGYTAARPLLRAHQARVVLAG